VWRSALRSDGSTGIGRVVPLPELSETQRSARFSLCGIQKRGLRRDKGEITKFNSSPGRWRGFCAKCGSTLTCEGERSREMECGHTPKPVVFSPTVPFSPRTSSGRPFSSTRFFGAQNQASFRLKSLRVSRRQLCGDAGILAQEQNQRDQSNRRGRQLGTDQPNSLSTPKELGLTVPLPLLTRTDEVIE